MEFTTQITIKNTFSKATADKKAALAEQIANNLDESALGILAEKSKKAGMSDKLRKYASMI